MQSTATTPQDYLDGLDDDWRRDTLLALRQLILDAAPTWAETIAYKMLCYADAQGAVFHLNAQKNYVSLYVGNATKVDSSGELLAGLDVGKGCIRFKRNTLVAETRIAEFIRQAVALRNAGQPIGC